MKNSKVCHSRRSLSPHICTSSSSLLIALHLPTLCEQKPLQFSIVERYQDQAAIDAHMKSKYYSETADALKDHIAGISVEL
jgi:hypothetical protein